jgi:hypothetical protein
LSDGAIAPHGEIEDRLLALAERHAGDLLATRAQKVAFSIIA